MTLAFCRNGLENVSIVFSKPEKRASWEESFNEAKHKLGKYLFSTEYILNVIR